MVMVIRIIESYTACMQKDGGRDVTNNGNGIRSNRIEGTMSSRKRNSILCLICINRTLQTMNQNW